MHIRSIILGAVSAVALSGEAACADDMFTNYHAMASGDFGQTSVAHVHFSDYDFGGALAIPAGLWGGNAQVAGSYSKLSSSGIDVDQYNIGGALFWNCGDWRLGGNVSYTNTDFGTSINATNYGAFAEYFASKSFTISAKAGGVSGNASLSGYYLGGQTKWYLTPNLSISAAIDYDRFEQGSSHIDEIDSTLGAEYLISKTIPVALFGTYTHAGITPGTLHADNWAVGLRFYTDSNGPSTLVDRQRTGVVSYGAAYAPQLLKF